MMSLDLPTVDAALDLDGNGDDPSTDEIEQTEVA